MFIVTTPLLPLSILLIGLFYCVYNTVVTIRHYRLLKRKRWGGIISRYGFRGVRRRVLQLVICIPFYLYIIETGVRTVANLFIE